MEGTQFSQF